MSRPLTLVPPLPPDPEPEPTGIRRILDGDEGMSTVEYAVGTVVAAAFAAILYVLLSSEPVTAALGALVQRALTVNF